MRQRMVCVNCISCKVVGFSKEYEGKHFLEGEVCVIRRRLVTKRKIQIQNRKKGLIKDEKSMTKKFDDLYSNCIRFYLKSI